jgi:hypothetical protein
MSRRVVEEARRDLGDKLAETNEVVYQGINEIRKTQQEYANAWRTAAVNNLEFAYTDMFRVGRQRLSENYTSGNVITFDDIGLNEPGGRPFAIQGNVTGAGLVDAVGTLGKAIQTTVKKGAGLDQNIVAALDKYMTSETDRHMQQAYGEQLKFQEANAQLLMQQKNSEACQLLWKGEPLENVLSMMMPVYEAIPKSNPNRALRIRQYQSSLATEAALTIAATNPDLAAQNITSNSLYTQLMDADQLKTVHKFIAAAKEDRMQQRQKQLSDDLLTDAMSSEFPGLETAMDRIRHPDRYGSVYTPVQLEEDIRRDRIPEKYRPVLTQMLRRNFERNNSFAMEAIAQENARKALGLYTGESKDMAAIYQRHYMSTTNDTGERNVEGLMGVRLAPAITVTPMGQQVQAEDRLGRVYQDEHSTELGFYSRVMPEGCAPLGTRVLNAIQIGDPVRQMDAMVGAAAYVSSSRSAAVKETFGKDTDTVLDMVAYFDRTGDLEGARAMLVHPTDYIVDKKSSAYQTHKDSAVKEFSRVVEFVQSKHPDVSGRILEALEPAWAQTCERTKFRYDVAMQRVENEISSNYGPTEALGRAFAEAEVLKPMEKLLGTSVENTRTIIQSAVKEVFESTEGTGLEFSIEDKTITPDAPFMGKMTNTVLGTEQWNIYSLRHVEDLSVGAEGKYQIYYKPLQAKTKAAAEKEVKKRYIDKDYYQSLDVAEAHAERGDIEGELYNLGLAYQEITLGRANPNVAPKDFAAVLGPDGMPLVVDVLNLSNDINIIRSARVREIAKREYERRSKFVAKHLSPENEALAQRLLAKEVAGDAE